MIILAKATSVQEAEAQTQAHSSIIATLGLPYHEFQKFMNQASCLDTEKVVKDFIFLWKQAGRKLCSFVGFLEFNHDASALILIL